MVKEKLLEFLKEGLLMTRDDVQQYVATTYQTAPERLWRKFPTYAVLRHADNRKWYGLLMTVPTADLGLPSGADTDILDVKLPVEQVARLQQEPGFLPAYHMNKTHWIAVRLDQVGGPAIHQLIATSYQLTQS